MYSDDLLIFEKYIYIELSVKISAILESYQAAFSFCEMEQTRKHYQFLPLPNISRVYRHRKHQPQKKTDFISWTECIATRPICQKICDPQRYLEVKAAEKESPNLIYRHNNLNSFTGRRLCADFIDNINLISYQDRRRVCRSSFFSFFLTHL